jgi:hypothetical protein
MLSAFAALGLSLAQTTPPAATPAPTLRAEARARVQTLAERTDWRRLDFDERWNQRSEVKAAIDNIANVWTPADRDVSSSRLPTGVMKFGPVSAFLVLAYDNNVPDGFLVTEIRAWSSPSPGRAVLARRVRVELPGEVRQLMLAEVRLRGHRIDRKSLVARQSSVGSKPSTAPESYFFEGPASDPKATGEPGALARKVTAAVARRTLDGLVNAPGWSSTALTDVERGPWWEVDLGRATAIEAVEVFGDPRAPEQLAGFVVVLFGDDGAELWRSAPAPAPAAGLERPIETGPACSQELHLRAHSTGSRQAGAGLARALDADPDPRHGWALAPEFDAGSAVVLLPSVPHPGDWLLVELHQAHGAGRVFSRFSVEVTTASPVVPFVASEVHAILWSERPELDWSADERRLVERFLSATADPGGPFSLADEDLVAAARARLAERVPATDQPQDGPPAAAVDGLRAIVTGASDGLSGVERIELAAFLAAGPR